MVEIKKTPKKFTYSTKVVWVESKKGLLSSNSKPTIEVSTPPEFKGHQGTWSPEDLFVASVNSCIMTTFLYYAEKKGLGFRSYESSAEGTLEKKEDGLIFSTIEVNPRILISRDKDMDMVKEILELAERACLISRSIKSKVILKPIIDVVDST